jgi:hypothetical protein
VSSFERDPRGPRPFHAVVGAGPQAGTDELRAAYEQAMRDAVKTGNHQRALELSRAFDALPADTRNRIYPHSTTSLPFATVGRQRPGTQAARRRRSTRLLHGRVWRRLFGYALLLGFVVLVGVSLFIHRHTY